MRSTNARPTLEATNNGKTRSRGLCAGCSTVAVSASAQTGSSGTSTGQSTTTAQPPSSSTADEETRPATTTFFGDTGLWFVPTAEVLANGKWSVSGYRRGTNYIQGYTNVGDFAGTFAVGIKDRAEIFGSFLVDTRIDRDIAAALRQRSRPSAASSIAIRRSIRTGPATTSATSTSARKINLLSRVPAESGGRRGARRWSSCRPARHDAGVSTGKADFSIDADRQQGSGEDRRSVRLSPATSTAASPTASTCRAARSAGARARRSRRAARSASRPS